MSGNTQDSKQIVEGFWAAMQTNDFKAAGEFLDDDYVLEWPQSGERIRGRANFVAVNENYRAHGRWESPSIVSLPMGTRWPQMW
jgi:hypothetical protein